MLSLLICERAWAWLSIPSSAEHQLDSSVLQSSKLVLLVRMVPANQEFVLRNAFFWIYKFIE
jgi:hypothetical protein